MGYGQAQEERRPGILALVEEVRRRNPRLPADEARARAKQLWHARRANSGLPGY